MAVIRNRTLRAFLLVSGCISVILGIIGIFIPLLPTTPFVLLAAWCFLKSSDDAHKWIYRQPVLGSALKNWEKNRSISRPAKKLAMTTILISGVLIWLSVANLWINIAVTLLLLGVSIFIFIQKEIGHPKN